MEKNRDVLRFYQECRAVKRLTRKAIGGPSVQVERTLNKTRYQHVTDELPTLPMDSPTGYCGHRAAGRSEASKVLFLSA